MTTLVTVALRLPKSIKAKVGASSKADGTRLNQFVVTAVAEKIAVLETTAFFEKRAARARAAARRGEPSALLAMLSRPGGEPPREGDELPEGDVSLAARTAPAGKRKVAKPAAAPDPGPKQKD